ncbi:hypothetical protein ACLOJK_018130 [Asimina triloba]
MERSEPTLVPLKGTNGSEPTLVPEWLKGTNGGTNSGSSSSGNSHHPASSSQFDDHAITLPTRSRSSVSSSDHDAPRSFMDRTSSSQIRRTSSSNGSIIDKDSNAHLRSYSSFTRSHRDKDWDWDKEIEFRLGDHGIHDTTSASLFSSKLEKDSLRHSQSMISGRRGEGWPRRLGNDAGSVGGSIISTVQKAAFERDFPSLGAEERQGVSDISRVSSPGIGSASQNLPMASASVIGGECWTSALAEIPSIVGSNNTVLSSIQQASPLNSPAAVPNTSTGLNMAETLVQAPARARTVPHLSVETQRLEELAIKQSRQLIPMRPSMPKTSALNSDKTKSKASRAGDLSNLTKLGHLSSPSQLVNHAARVPVRSDSIKASQVGKLHVLKAGRENNVCSPTAKDVPNLTIAGRVTATSSAVAPLKSPSNPKTAADHWLTVSPVGQSCLDKRHPSRSDFFNSLRKKNSVNHSAPVSDSNLVSSLSAPEKAGEQILETAAAISKGENEPAVTGSVLGWPTENGRGTVENNNVSEEPERLPAGVIKGSVSNAVIDPDDDLDTSLDPHEVAFLRSLGWEENGGGGALTEEEISSFYETMKSRKANAVSVAPEPNVGSLDSTSSVLSSTDSENEA